jgi:dihydroflavonol-4-reductase
VLGAPLDKNFGSSISLVERVLNGSDPMLPDLKFAIVDVRDVAKMHVDAIKNENTKGERIISSSETRSFVEIAKLLKSIYPTSKVKSAQAPTFIIRLLSLFDSSIKPILPQLGKPMNVSGAKAQRLLNINFISVDVTLKESADYLIKNGFIRIKP